MTAWEVYISPLMAGISFYGTAMNMNPIFARTVEISPAFMHNWLAILEYHQDRCAGRINWNKLLWGWTLLVSCVSACLTSIPHGDIAFILKPLFDRRNLRQVLWHPCCLLLGIIGSYQFFSKTALTIFLIFCMKVQDYNGKKRTRRFYRKNSNFL